MYVKLFKNNKKKYTRKGDNIDCIISYAVSIFQSNNHIRGYNLWDTMILAHGSELVQLDNMYSLEYLVKVVHVVVCRDWATIWLVVHIEIPISHEERHGK